MKLNKARRRPVIAIFAMMGIITIFVFGICINAIAQPYNLRLTVKTAAHTADSIYVAGSFNSWNPGDPKFLLNKTGDTYSISIAGLAQDIYQFKFTRGNWSSGEVTASGGSLENRLVNLQSDTTLEYTIAGWQDDFRQTEKNHTASGNVKLLDTAFYMPQLNRFRRIWIYLPPGYAASKKSKKRFPVLYMQDGQNIFDEYTAPFGEWGIDECLDSLIKNGEPPCIVVGIDCGPKRMNEYNPFYFEQFGEGEGAAYVGFIANTLKPYIDKNFRTLKSNENTIIAGSSMGGLISYYALLSFPEIFGKAGVFSPAFWTAPAIKQLTDSLGKDVSGSIFFYMGDLEGGNYVLDMTEVADKIGKQSEAVIYSVIDPVSRHNEQAWRKWFPEFYCWISSDGFNRPVKFEK